MNKIFTINTKELQFLGNKSDYIFVNLDYALAIKIGSYYDEIKKSEKKELIKLFNQLTDIEIRIDDTLGKLSIILLKLLMIEKRDNIVVSNIGFSVSSFEFLIANMKKIFQNLKGLNNRNIIILDCNLTNKEDIKYLNQYFNS
ncbi:hypothetical protein [Chryseobacterium sp. CCH4-E10]|uniref:hypothetical protein n=1 Tax=Chryseobacterium sp. CCH4-E10 TaxID=1768758 RepID=UPI00083549DC|nr:hypothetical protein [Chryseobacterium sp. CCH4-E10]